MKKRSTGFTLVEILVVLGIIAILAALLFPAFGRARESARQTNCQSNLQQIALAVDQYRKEEGRYPDTLLDLLGEGAAYDDGSATGNTLSATAPGYLKVSMDALVCQDDDSISDKPRSSYGSLSSSKLPPATALPAPQATTFDTFTGDYSNYVWNYWGLRPDGFAYVSAAEAAAATWSKPAPHAPFGTPPAEAELLVDPSRPYNHPDAPNYDNTLPVNVIKYSLSNRYAPPSTIITHCVYHRLPTANNLITPGMLYVGATEDSSNARDIVARVEPNSKGADVSNWLTQKTWQKQNQ